MKVKIKDLNPNHVTVLWCDMQTENYHANFKNNVEEAFAADELALSINAFLATCSEDQRNIFVRRYWYFDTVAEISKKYGYSQSKVKTALFRMREGLKQHLEKEGYAV